jgi:hypothetical protein|tara:strand:+ start:270 stop:536 length:267 start_codon:yes stop_codon:yes gene_type:complete
MTGRYLRRLQLRETWRITRGFALKQAATDADLARELFFDGALPAAALALSLALTLALTLTTDPNQARSPPTRSRATSRTSRPTRPAGK